MTKVGTRWAALPVCSTVNKSTYATAIRTAIVNQMANDTEQVDQRNMVHA
jgi:hypothetical protein